MLEPLIDPRRTAIRGENDKGDQYQAEEEGEQVFAGEEIFHFVNTKGTKYTKVERLFP
jgi:hypothetical protein